MNTAFPIRALRDWRGEAVLYRLDPPLEHTNWGDDAAILHEFVVVSAADVPFTGPETYIFGADESGEVTEWGELSGSQRGTLSHAQALGDAGYQIILPIQGEVVRNQIEA